MNKSLVEYGFCIALMLGLINSTICWISLFIASTTHIVIVSPLEVFLVMPFVWLNSYILASIIFGDSGEDPFEKFFASLIMIMVLPAVVIAFFVFTFCENVLPSMKKMSK